MRTICEASFHHACWARWLSPLIAHIVKNAGDARARTAQPLWMLEVIMLAIGTNFDYPPIKGEELSFQTVDGRRELSTMI